MDRPERNPGSVESVEPLTVEERERVEALLDDPRAPYEIDWDTLPPASDLAARLEILTAIQVQVPADNIEVQKDTHNTTVENHLKLLLKAAGTTHALGEFLDLADRHLAVGDELAEEHARQAFLLWAPAAEIIGRHDLKERLEQSAFEILYPEEKAAIDAAYTEMGGNNALIQTLWRYREVIEQAAAELDPVVGPRIQASCRGKSHYSIWRKCMMKERMPSEVADFMGIRVVVPSDVGELKAVELCYAIASEVGELFDPAQNRLKDYVQQPKPNGYQSLHLVVEDGGAPLEVQIRTSEMHQRAESDPRMSHLGYEAAKLTPGKHFRAQLADRPRTYRWRDKAVQELATRPDGNLENLHPEEVVFFTPDGNCYVVPVGATSLDASFRIHSLKALATEGIKANGRPVRFEQPVTDGTLLEVRYGRQPAEPNATWLETVTTAQAKGSLRRAIKRARADQLEATGLQKLREAFPDLKNPLDLLTERDRLRILRKYQVGNINLVLREIGAGDASPEKLIGHLRRLLSK